MRTVNCPPTGSKLLLGSTNRSKADGYISSLCTDNASSHWLSQVSLFLLGCACVKVVDYALRWPAKPKLIAAVQAQVQGLVKQYAPRLQSVPQLGDKNNVSQLFGAPADEPPQDQHQDLQEMKKIVQDAVTAVQLQMACEMAELRDCVKLIAAEHQQSLQCLQSQWLIHHHQQQQHNQEKMAREMEQMKKEMQSALAAGQEKMAAEMARLKQDVQRDKQEALEEVYQLVSRHTEAATEAVSSQIVDKFHDKEKEVNASLQCLQSLWLIHHHHQQQHNQEKMAREMEQMKKEMQSALAAGQKKMAAEMARLNQDMQHDAQESAQAVQQRMRSHTKAVTEALSCQLSDKFTAMEEEVKTIGWILSIADAVVCTARQQSLFLHQHTDTQALHQHHIALHHSSAVIGCDDWDQYMIGQHLHVTSSTDDTTHTLQKFGGDVKLLSSNHWRTARSALCFTAGRHAWEVKVVHTAGRHIIVGVIDDTVDMDKGMYCCPGGWALNLRDGRLWHDNKQVGKEHHVDGCLWQASSVHFILDMDSRTLAVSGSGGCNKEDATVVFQGLPAKLYAAVALLTDGDAVQLHHKCVME